jgi:hypothetical protein
MVPAKTIQPTHPVTSDSSMDCLDIDEDPAIMTPSTRGYVVKAPKA